MLARVKTYRGAMIAVVVAGAIAIGTQVFGSGGESNVARALLGYQGATIPSGYAGEYTQSCIPTGSKVALSNGTAKDVTNLSLGKGHWMVTAAIEYVPNSSYVGTFGDIAIHTAADTLPASSTVGDQWLEFYAANTSSSGNEISASLPPVHLYLSSTTTYHLVTRVGFSAGSVSAFGCIKAWRQ